MAVSAYLTLAGQKQGPIKGGVTQKGREGTILVTSWSWVAERSVPSGTTSGKPSGDVQIGEFHLTKARDVSTPKLTNALAGDELLTTWQLDLYDESPQGERLTTRIDLTNAVLASQRLGGVIAPGGTDAEELTFAFDKLTVTWVNGNITGAIGTASP